MPVRFPPSRFRLVQTLTVAGAALWSAACALGRNPQRDGPALCPRPTATVYVTNHNWSDVVVYVVQRDSRYLLGRVVSSQSDLFPVPPASVAGAGEFYLLIDPGRPEVFVSPPITLRPGHTLVDLTVENHISYSSVFIHVEETP
ncbi:MAG: hypothetical protein HY560_07165 [Gemmatimonadetes bacterium]|nr:hypothetical protein [Gemmatimonadota bacterium]